MNNSLDNVGQKGVESIRLGGRKVEDLPIAESALAKQQLSVARDVEKQNRVSNILARYPNQRVPYLDSRIKEARENIERVGRMIEDENKLINDYKGHISLCNFRDKEITRINSEDSSEESKKEQIKELHKKYPPYQIKAMEQQIRQSKESIERGNLVLRQENKSIAEMVEVLGLCKARDLELKAIGVTLSSTG